ncbi:hypothetical protein [Mesorhizobium sp. CAU 1741]|uniref:hypothetical protein n=1 Tax=Mesorhizobium sp. CAU 1741 TaxID=3140366 RepID=UPI00325B70E9
MFVIGESEDDDATTIATIELENTMQSKELVAGYVEWVEDRLDAGYEPYMLTFMFKPIPGSPARKQIEMYDTVRRTFEKVLTRTNRRPRKEAWDRLPLWMGCTDWPIPKWDKDHYANIALNDGQHVHIMALESPHSRLRKRGILLSDHIFFDEQRLYFDAEPHLHRIHTMEIHETPGEVTDYVFKAIKSGRTGCDDILVLPRAVSELN